MADLTSVGVTSGVPSSGTGDVATINQLIKVGSPISNGSTSAPVIASLVGPSSAVTSSMTGVVSAIGYISSAVTIQSVASIGSLSSGTVFVSSGSLATVGTINSISSGTFAIANGANVAAVKAAATAPSTSDPALVVSISPNSVNANGQALSSNSAPVVIASNQPAFPVQISSGTVTLSSNPTVIPSSVTSVSLSTTVGLTISSVIISTTTNATLVSSAPRQLCKVECFNLSTTPGFLKMYNLSSVPTAGSSQVFNRYPVPTNGFISTVELSDTYSAGLAYTFTANLIDSDTTAIQTSSTYVVNLHYR